MNTVSASTNAQVARFLSDKIEDDVRLTTFRAKSSVTATTLDVMERLLAPLISDAGSQLDVLA